MHPDQQHVDSIFLAAAEKATASERAAYLDVACASDPELRERVERLLTAQSKVSRFLEAPAPALIETVDEPPATERPGTVVGPYKLLEQIGEGGMGAVWMAEQTEPIQRRVAVKVVKEGMDSRQVLARFEAERQALALMEHPNIAKVLDAGKAPSGRPYFVMELVKGQPITGYCDEKRLGVRDRLELFGDVCRAVQHAHQKGVIHRDLKPSNVLVAPYDGKPVVKVIDFGVAKATGQRLTDKTLFTGFGAVVGTPEYMSPEQAEVNNQDIDTRSDIYSLGVLLYELLTGSTPLTRQRTKEAALLEVLRLIREEEPPRPSTRLSESKESLPSISAQRQTEPAKLTRLVRGELDWIVMKALEKDRARRYETANGFARDIRRYLADEPVEACPPSRAYRLRKFARKNQRGLVTAAAFAVLLLIGGVISAWQAVRATRAEAKALTARDAEAASGAEARAVLKFFQDKVLAAARPEGEDGGLGREVTIRTAVEAAEPGIAAAFSDRPAVEAAIRTALGDTYYYLGLLAPALRQFERARALRHQALGPDHPDTLQSMNDIAEAYLALGRLPEALDLHEETLKLRRANLGLDHSDTFMSMNNVAKCYQGFGWWPEAIALREETLKRRQDKLGPDHAYTLHSMNELVLTLGAAGRWREALPLAERTLEMSKKKFGLDGPTHQSMNTLAIAYGATDQLEKQLALQEQTVNLMRKKWSPDHPALLVVMHNLASSYLDAGRVAEGLDLAEEVFKLCKAKPGPDPLRTHRARLLLASAYADAGRSTDALALYKETLRLCEDNAGTDHPFTLDATRCFAQFCLAQGDYASAEKYYLRVLDFKAKLGLDHPEVAYALSGLGSTYLKKKKYNVAEQRLRECLDIYRKTDPDNWRHFNVQSLLGGSLLEQGKHAEAEPLLLAGYEGMRQREAKIVAMFKVRLPEALERLVQFYEATGKPNTAAKWRKEFEEAKAAAKEAAKR
jgi:serine/threonine protein kinase